MKKKYVYNPSETMNSYLAAALSALDTGNTNRGLIELVMALQEMSARLDAIEEKLGINEDNDR